MDEAKVIRASVLGATAKDFLDLPDFSGQVLAVLSDTVYLAAPADDLFWLAQESSDPPLHPRAIVARYDPAALRAGLSFRRRSGGLQFDNGVRLDAENARTWNPPRPDPERAAEHAAVAARARELAAVIQSLDCGESLARTIPTVLALVDGLDTPPLSSPGLVLSAALAPIKETVHWCRARDLAHIGAAAQPLIGLGQGLTPSGDDWIGGLLFAATQYHLAYPGELAWDQAAVDELLEWARTRTNRISWCLLRDYTRGHGPEPLHTLVDGLLQARGMDGLLVSVRSLIAIGSSSGWDVLAGMMAGLLALEPSATRRR